MWVKGNDRATENWSQRVIKMLDIFKIETFTVSV